MPTLGPTTVADAIAEELSAAGIDRVFGLPGGEVLLLVDAFHRHGIEFTLFRHESNAAMAAIGYGKLTGTVGVVLTTLGPGAANLLLPISNSWLDREPLLAITADIPASWPRTHTHQRLPLLELFEPIVKFRGSLNGLNARFNVRQAIARSSEAPGGPSLLTVSADQAGMPSLEHVSGARPAVVGSLPVGDANAVVSELESRLQAAERPLIVAGIGTQNSNAERLRSWLSNWNLPVAVTPKVKGIVDETRENFVGVVGGMSIDNLMLEAIHDADLAVGFGFDPVESDKLWHADVPILWVLESAQATGILPKDDLLVATHAAVLDQLANRPPPRRWSDPFSEVRSRRRKIYMGSGPGQTGRGIIPLDLVRTLANTFSEETIVTTDVGSHKYLFGQFWPSKLPGTFHMSNGLSGMGYGLPVAIGAKLAHPSCPVLAVVGDGGFSMYSQELETAHRLGANIVVVVLADHSYSLIRHAQQTRGLPRYGVDFLPIDSVQIAEACGIEGTRATTVEELQRAANRAVSAVNGYVIEVAIDPDSWRGLV